MSGRLGARLAAVERCTGYAARKRWERVEAGEPDRRRRVCADHGLTDEVLTSLVDGDPAGPGLDLAEHPAVTAYWNAFLDACVLEGFTIIDVFDAARADDTRQVAAG